MRRSRLVMSLLCIAGVLVGCTSGDAGWSGVCEAGDPIVALSRVGSYEGSVGVSVMTRDGDLSLVTGDWFATKPSLSPDGKRLVVVRSPFDYSETGPTSTSLWVLRTDGTHRRALTQGSLDEDPAWSPDGKLIAFARQTAMGDPDVPPPPPAAYGFPLTTQLMTVSARGGGERLLMPKSGSRDLSPAWSSDGQQVAFIRGEAQPESSETTTVWVVGADGTNARALAAVPYAHSLEWDPDGESLLVSTKDLHHNGSLSLVDVTTGDVRKLADDATLGAWFPDGEHIVYFTKDGARQSPGWRLALARVDRRLERESFVGDVQEYPSSYFGITTACAP